MEKEVLVALIGACSTIAVASIGAYASIAAKRRPPKVKPGVKLNHSYKFEFWIVSAAIIVGALILALGIRSARETGESKKIESLAGDVSKQLKSYQNLVSTGLKERKDYIIPALTMVIRLEQVGEGGSQRIESDTRIIYQIHALKDISSENSGFYEFFNSSSSQEVRYLPGADKEKLQEARPDRPGRQAWEVYFDVAAGEQRTIVTGARAIYPPTLKAGRNVHFFPNVGSNQDAFVYPNFDNDVIGELVIMVESSTLDLQLLSGEIMAGIQRGNKIINVDAQLFQGPSGSPKRRVAVARFRQIQNRDVAGIKVAW